MKNAICRSYPTVKEAGTMLSAIVVLKNAQYFHMGTIRISDVVDAWYLDVEQSC